MTAALAGRGQRLPTLWPAHCLVCREPCPADGSAADLCPACRDALPWNRSACARCALPMPAPTAACGRCLRHPPPLAAVHAAFVYGPPLDRLLPRLKFHDDLAAGRLLASLMAESLAGRAAADAEVEASPPGFGVSLAASWPHAVIPLPLHRRRLRQRGYDQALELARPLARALALPLRTDLLQRVRETAPQSRLDAPARRKNLRGAFVATSATASPLSHVVLIDDVMTTGATLHAAAAALRRAGIARVDAWVCARVP
ncbi:MAG: ComF family protein [Lysobacter sp.]|nr:ComF family protein [Lysobacter sp.]